MIQSDKNTAWTEVERQEVISEAHTSRDARSMRLSRRNFRRQLKDRRYQHLWPMLEQLTQAMPSASTPEPAGLSLSCHFIRLAKDARRRTIS